MDSAPPQLTPREQRKWICEVIPELTHHDATDVFKWLNARLPRNSFSEHSNGCSINLDTLANELVSQLYSFVVSKVNTEIDDGAERSDGDDRDGDGTDVTQ